MVLLWAGSGSLALAKEVSLSPDLGGEDTSKLGDFPVPDLKITQYDKMKNFLLEGNFPRAYFGDLPCGK